MTAPAHPTPSTHPQWITNEYLHCGIREVSPRFEMNINGCLCAAATLGGLAELAAGCWGCRLGPGINATSCCRRWALLSTLRFRFPFPIVRPCIYASPSQQAGGTILERLLNMARGGLLLR